MNRAQWRAPLDCSRPSLTSACPQGRRLTHGGQSAAACGLTKPSKQRSPASTFRGLDTKRPIQGSTMAGEHSGNDMDRLQQPNPSDSRGLRYTREPRRIIQASWLPEEHPSTRNGSPANIDDDARQFWVPGSAHAFTDLIISGRTGCVF
jgi:hypothetical protein